MLKREPHASGGTALEAAVEKAILQFKRTVVEGDREGGIAFILDLGLKLSATGQKAFEAHLYFSAASFLKRIGINEDAEEIYRHASDRYSNMASMQSRALDFDGARASYERMVHIAVQIGDEELRIAALEGVHNCSMISRAEAIIKAEVMWIRRGEPKAESDKRTDE